MLIMCPQSSVHQMNFVMNRFVEFLGVPQWSKVARGFSHCILFSRCWIHFRTVFLSQTWNVKSNSAPPTDLHVLASGGAGIPTELIFLCFWGKNSLFALSHIGCYLWLCGYTIHDPTACLEFATGLSESRNWRTFLGVNTNSPHLPWLVLTICWNKSLWVQPRFYTNECGVQNLEQHICTWEGKELWGKFLDHSSWNGE